MARRDKQRGEATVKENMLAAIRRLPENATYEDGMDTLFVLAKIEIGLDQAAAGQTIPQEEVERLVERWFMQPDHPSTTSTTQSDPAEA